MKKKKEKKTGLIFTGIFEKMTIRYWILILLVLNVVATLAINIKEYIPSSKRCTANVEFYKYENLPVKDQGFSLDIEYEQDPLLLCIPDKSCCELEKLVILSNQKIYSNSSENYILRDINHANLNKVVVINNFRTSLINLATLKNHTFLVQTFLMEGADPYQPDSYGNTALHNAVLNKNIVIIQLLIKTNSYGINKTNKRNETAIFLSSLLNETRIFNFLLDEGADPDISNTKNESTLHMASVAGNLDLAKTLLKRSKLNVNQQTTEGITAFFLATRYGKTNICSLLLNSDAQPYVQTKTRETSLHMATVTGNEEIVKLILSKSKLGINIQNNNGSTALLIAASRNNTDIGKILLCSGSRPFITNIYNRTALHEAVKCNNLELIHLILNQSNNGINIRDIAGFSAFSIAFQQKAISIWKFLLEAGAVPHISSDVYNTPLHEAASHGDLNSVNLILKHSVNWIKSVNSDGKSALHLAVANNHSEMVSILLKNGAEPTLTDYEGRTPLHISVKDNLFPIVKCLVDFNLSLINIQDNYWKTALHLATERRNEPIFTHLIKSGAISLPDSNGWIPLHNAADNGNIYYLQILLSQNTAINFQNYAGDTALHIAAKRNDNRIIQFLVKNGADPGIRNYEGQTALHIAAIFGKTAALRELLKHTNETTLNILDFEGLSPVSVAAKSSIKALEVLLEKDSKTFKFSENYDTPLHVAAHNGQLSAVKLILGKFPGIINHSGAGNTPIQKAIGMLQCYEELIKYLLQSEADTLIISDRGETVFHFAAFWCPKTLLEELYMITEEKIKARGLGKTYLLEFINREDVLGRTPLIIAASKDNEEAFHFFLQKGSNIRQTNSHGCSILVEAGRGGNVQIIEFVLNETKIPVDDACIDGLTPLMAAANDGNTDAFEYLIKRGSKLNVVTPFKKTVLHYAVSGVIAMNRIISIILNDNETNVDARTVEDFTPLMLAIQSWNYNAVDLLLKHGADPLMKNIYGETPILIAVREGDLKGTFDFVRRGLKPFSYDSDTLLGIVLASQRKWQNEYFLKELLKESSISKYPLFYAAALGDFKEVNAIHSAGVLVKDKKFPGVMRTLLEDYDNVMSQLIIDDDEIEHLYQSRMTLLDISVLFFGHINIIKKIIQEFRLDCSSLNYRTKMWTPIDFAMFGYERTESRYSNSRILHFLLSLCNCCLSKSTNNFGWTLAHKAAWANNLIAIQYLQKFHVDLDEDDTYGRTPLHIAALRGHHSAIVQFLHFTNKSINAKDIHGFTPLHLSQIFQYKKFFQRLSTTTITLPFIERHKLIQRFIKFSREAREAVAYQKVSAFLIDNGAELDVQDRAFGWTALHWASAAGSLDNVAMLISKGARVNVDSWNKQTAMAVARIWGRTSVYNFLKTKNGVW